MRERRYFILFIGLAIALGARAQRPCYDKMSPLVREACLAGLAPRQGHATGQSSASGAKAHGAAKEARTLTAMVKTDGTAPPDGCDVLARYGNLYVASVPLGRLGWLSRQPHVLRIEAGRRAHATMDTTALIVGAMALRHATDLPQMYTGSGVVVGVQDIGFDLTHPNFWSADMTRYRIKALWDQLSTDTLGSTLPAGRDYRDSLTLLTLGRPRDGDMQTHGTHTTGIAAGSGGEGGGAAELGLYAGIAPDADICLVCNATSDDAALIDTADYYKYTYALDALGFKYIFDYADSVGKPCVINFSEGSSEDMRGDDMLYYEMLDSITGPGHIIVASAGNEGGYINYISKPEGVDSVSFNISSLTRQLSFTTRTTAGFTLRLADAGAGLDRTYSLADISATPDSLLCDTVATGQQTYILMAASYPDSYDGSLTACDWLLQSTAKIGTPAVTLAGASAGVELFPVSASLHAPASAAPGVVADNSHSIMSPGSAPCVVCVGSTSYRTQFTNWRGDLKVYDHGTGGVRTYFTSVGPTWDGRTKPDVMAPGDNVISSYSSYYLEHNPEAHDISSDVRHFAYNGRTYAWNSNAGTSMSAPVVTGVIALWLQANPRLTPQDCLGIIAETSTRYDTALSYPNNLYGYGQIDAEAGMRLVLEQVSGIKEISQSGTAAVKVFAIDGKFAGSYSPRDIGRLPKGIYIIKGRKILVR